MTDLIGYSLLAQVGGEISARVAPAPVGLSIGGKLIMLVLLFVLPYVAGALVARALRLKEYSNRIGTVLLAFTLGLAPFFYEIGTTGEWGSWKKCLRLGIDLNGGTNLIYQVDTKQAEEEKKDINQAMNMMVGVIQKRINPSGTEEMVVRRVGSDRIEIIIPGADQGVVAQKKADMTRIGSLEFGIVANTRDHASLIRGASALPETINAYSEGNRVAAIWRDMWPDEKVPGDPGSIGIRQLTKRKAKNRKKEEVTVTQILIVQNDEDDRVTGKYLTNAGKTLSKEGKAAVTFQFNGEGARRFYNLTYQNRPTADKQHFRLLSILLDEKVHSAPRINDVIRDSGQITGDFSPKELDALVNVLNAGALELPIKPDPVSEFTISPLLGEDVQRKGMTAIWVSSLAVFVFMLVYYRFSGMVADMSLILNLVLIVGAMAICNATFTLPGLAGMVLTIGMAVDTNVLIYERMREEMARGSSLKMTIHNGFDKALSAIVDSNITTLIAAVILYIIGTDQIKGFAVSLFIGITMSMFSALYFGHLMFDIAERKRWIRDKLSMFQVIGTTNFDFIKQMKTAVTFSVGFIVLGVTLVIARGTDSLDIDLSGGSTVTFQFTQPQQIEKVKGKLNDTFQGAISLERLALRDEDSTSDSGKQFRLRTKEQNIAKIRDGIETTFKKAGYELRKVTVEFTKPTVATEAVSGIGSSTSDLDGAKGFDDLKADEGKDEFKKPETEKKDESKKDDAKPAEPAAEKKSADDPKKPAEVKPAEAEETTTSEPKEAAATKSDGKSKSAKMPQLPKFDFPDDKTADSLANTDPFANGLRSELAFSGEITTTTAGDYLMAALRKTNPNKFKEADAEALLRISGIGGSGMKEAEGKVKTFNKMLLETKTGSVTTDDLDKSLADMKQTMNDTPIFEEVSNFASSVAEDMRTLALVALLASGVATVIYLWFRFTKADFGLAAVVAVFHDVLFVLATLPFAFYLSKTPLGPLLGLEDFKLNLSIVAAFLTIIGYSLNDTIVIFDRVREIRGRNPLLTTQMVNDSVNQTLSRTILTAVTVFITVIILYALGGDGIHGFAFCMLIGTVVGTYSTVFIASPFLLWMMNREQQKTFGKKS